MRSARPEIKHMALLELLKQRGRCRGQVSLFYGYKGERPDVREAREAEARELCRVCPVLFECRTYVSENKESGLWAGLNEEERFVRGMPVELSSRNASAIRRKHGTSRQTLSPISAS